MCPAMVKGRRGQELEWEVGLGPVWRSVLDRWWLPVGGLVAGAIIGLLFSLGASSSGLRDRSNKPPTNTRLGRRALSIDIINLPGSRTSGKPPGTCQRPYPRATRSPNSPTGHQEARGKTEPVTNVFRSHCDPPSHSSQPADQAKAV
jgi:hypothetical protein